MGAPSGSSDIPTPILTQPKRGFKSLLESWWHLLEKDGFSLRTHPSLMNKIQIIYLANEIFGQKWCVIKSFDTHFLIWLADSHWKQFWVMAKLFQEVQRFLGSWWRKTKLNRWVRWLHVKESERKKQRETWRNVWWKCRRREFWAETDILEFPNLKLWDEQLREWAPLRTTFVVQEDQEGNTLNRK